MTSLLYSLAHRRDGTGPRRVRAADGNGCRRRRCWRIAAIGDSDQYGLQSWDTATQDDLGATGSGGKLMQLDIMIPVTAILVAVDRVRVRSAHAPDSERADLRRRTRRRCCFTGRPGGPRARWWRPEDGSSACCLFLPFFALRGMGGGDVKLLAALGAWLGPEQVVVARHLHRHRRRRAWRRGRAAAHGYLKTAMRNVSRRVHRTGAPSASSPCLD